MTGRAKPLRRVSSIESRRDSADAARRLAELRSAAGGWRALRDRIEVIARLIDQDRRRP